MQPTFFARFRYIHTCIVWSCHHFVYAVLVLTVAWWRGKCSGAVATTLSSQPWSLVQSSWLLRGKLHGELDHLRYIKTRARSRRFCRVVNPVSRMVRTRAKSDGIAGPGHLNPLGGRYTEAGWIHASESTRDHQVKNSGLLPRTLDENVRNTRSAC